MNRDHADFRPVAANPGRPPGFWNGRIEDVESQQREHASIVSAVVEEIEDMKQPPEPPRRRIAF